uniref:Uncharacterized protein n=1 Tax=Peronospora matthiolae TaxID=2874970 RepID=A0AAV1URX0_9STRA
MDTDGPELVTLLEFLKPPMGKLVRSIRNIHGRCKACSFGTDQVSGEGNSTMLALQNPEGHCFFQGRMFN